MSTRADPSGGPIVVTARLWGPRHDARVKMALDTGATTSLISTEWLIHLGYDPGASRERLPVTTGSGVERVQVPILAHTLPPSAPIDGLLGLDFLRGTVLTVDLRAGVIDLR